MRLIYSASGGTKIILPALGNEFVTLVKETSVAGYIGLRDLTKASDIVASRTYDYFVPLIFGGLRLFGDRFGLNQAGSYVREEAGAK